MEMGNSYEGNYSEIKEEHKVRQTPEVYPDLQEVKDALTRKIELLEEEVSNLYYRVEDLERGR